MTIGNTDRKERRRGVAFWRKSTGNYCSHYLGLTKEDREMLIEELQQDRPVRFILYSQTDNGANSPDFVLRFFKEESAQQGVERTYTAIPHNTSSGIAAATNPSSDSI